MGKLNVRSNQCATTWIFGVVVVVVDLPLLCVAVEGSDNPISLEKPCQASLTPDQQGHHSLGRHPEVQYMLFMFVQIFHSSMYSTLRYISTIHYCTIIPKYYANICNHTLQTHKTFFTSGQKCTPLTIEPRYSNTPARSKSE